MKHERIKENHMYDSYSMKKEERIEEEEKEKNCSLFHLKCQCDK